MCSDYKIGHRNLNEVVTLLHILICKHKKKYFYAISPRTNVWLMLAYPMYYLDKYCLRKSIEDAQITFSVDTLAPIVHEAWSKIYTFRLNEEIKQNSGLNAKNPFTAKRTKDSLSSYETLSKEGKAINKLYAYMYLLLLEEYAKKTYPKMRFSFN